jgi:hypothetical protein
MLHLHSCSLKMLDRVPQRAVSRLTDSTMSLHHRLNRLPITRQKEDHPAPVLRHTKVRRVIKPVAHLMEAATARSADYVFRKYNVVAELKCLVVDQTAETTRKLAEIIKERQAAPAPEPGPNLHLLPITSAVNGKNIPFDESLQHAVGKVLLQPIENLIRDANRQIRATKARLSLPSAHGVVLLFNEGNPLHAASPQHFGRLVGEVIQKPRSGERRFPHIQGIIYFSLRVPSFDEQTQKRMPFWFPAQVQGDSVEEIKHFQEDLKRGWYQYIEIMSGAAVVSHHRETGWPV